MRAILEDVRSGEVTSHEVPQPELRPGGIVVRTAFSAISAGTELAHREQVEKSLLGKALARPDLARQVVDFARAAWGCAGRRSGTRRRCRAPETIILGFSDSKLDSAREKSNLRQRHFVQNHLFNAKFILLSAPVWRGSNRNHFPAPGTPKLDLGAANQS
jgi:hypothetical protein